jgi:Card1-like, endonuclease domain
MRVLLCLLSEQHVPNLLSVHHFRPERLLLVETEDMKRRGVGDHFLRALRVGGLDYANRCEREPLAHEDALPEIRRVLQVAYGRHPTAEWIVNVTGGTKPMSIAAYQFFSVLNAETIYISSRDPQLIRWMDGSRSEPCRHRPSVAEFLAGYGFESRKPPSKVAEAEKRASQWWDCARVLAAHAPAEDLLRFNDDGERKQARDRGMRLEECHLNPAWLSIEPVCQALQQTFGLPGKVDKYQAQFLSGEWLEVFLWGLLDRNRGPLGVWDVNLGLEPARFGDTSGNEFDVAFMRDYSLWMIECKTGEQGHDLGGEIFYKVEAVVRQFRALHVRTILATASDFLLDPKTGRVKQGLRTRAEIYRCIIAGREQIRELARSEAPVEALERVMADSDSARMGA